MTALRKLTVSLVLALFLASVLPPAPALANETGTEDNDDVAIVFDLVVTRPLGLVATVAGTAIFIVALPFSVPTGSVEKTFNALVKQPFRYTFVREMGESSVEP
jgi:hypothetical protein